MKYRGALIRKTFLKKKTAIPNSLSRIKLLAMVSSSDINENFIKSRYKFLKKKAVEDLRRLSGANGWTDYGLHDTGMVILEQLCHHIIDLELRASIFIADILAHESKAGLDSKILALNAEGVLPSNARCRNDFLKLILDCAGVKNARILTSDLENEIKGGYKMYVLTEHGYTKTSIQQNDFLEKIFARLQEHRNLCEDFFELRLIERKKFHIKADLEIDESIPQEKAATTIAEVLFCIQNFLTPTINFYSLSEMLTKRGYSVEEIFSGPLLENGFIDNRDLATNAIKNQLNPYEIVEQISLNKNVRSVLSLAIYLEDERVPIDFKKISDVEAFELDIEKSVITLLQNGNPVYASPSKVDELYKNLDENRKLQKSLCTKEEINYNKGEYKKIFKYNSLQNDFPLVYGLGIEGPRYRDSDSLKRNTNNLKGYLLLFDQILANSLARLANAKVFFSMRLVEEKDFLVQLPDSVPYLEKLIKPLTNTTTQNLEAEEFCAQRSLLGIAVDDTQERNTPENKFHHCSQYLKSIIQLQDLNAAHVNKVLDFILSLVGEKFYDDFLKIGLTSDEDLTNKIVNAKRGLFADFYKKTFEAPSNYSKQKESPKTKISSLERRMKKLLAIENENHTSLCEVVKSSFRSFLANETKKRHAKPKDQTLDEETDNALQFEGKFPKMQNLILKYGSEIANYDIDHAGTSNTYTITLFFDRDRNKKVKLKKQRNINTIDEAEEVIQESISFIKQVNKASEGLYIVEHILLRPATTLENRTTNDPYSFRLTVVLPSWPARFQRKEFRDALHKIVIENSPAHLLVNVLWLDFDEMETFEKLHNSWLQLHLSRGTDPSSLKTASKNLLGLLIMYSNDHV